MIKKLLNLKKGATLGGYGLVAGLIGLIAVGAVTELGGRIFSFFNIAADEIEIQGPANENASEQGQENSQNSVPDIVNVEVPEDGEYGVGDTLTFKLTFSKKVKVKDGSYIEINIGGEIRQALYTEGSGTPTITFEYTITANDIDTDGIEFEDPEVDNDTGDGVSDNDGEGEADSDFDDEAPDMGGVTIPGPPTCSADCVYIGLEDGTFMKLSDDGKPVWQNSYHSGEVRAITVGPNGKIYVGGEGSVIRAYNPDGTVAWQKYGPYGDINDIAVSKNGDVVVAARTGTIYKYNSTGAFIAANHDTKSDDSYSTMDWVTGIATTPDNYVYGVSAYGRVSKIRLSDMATMWLTETASDHLDGVAVGSNRKLYLAGWDINNNEQSGHDDEYIYELTDNGGLDVTLTEYWDITGRVKSFALSPDGHITVGTNVIQPITRDYAYTYVSGQPTEIWARSGYKYLNDMTYDRNGFLWIAGEDKTVRKRNQTDGVQDGLTFRFDYPVTAIAVEPGLPGSGY